MFKFLKVIVIAVGLVNILLVALSLFGKIDYKVCIAAHGKCHAYVQSY